MCFYDNIVFDCGDWKWGNFRHHCQKEYRVGEMCGMKFVYDTIREHSKCHVCLSLDKKYRRYTKAISDYNRWVDDPTRQASAEKAAQGCREIFHEIEKLNIAGSSSYMSPVYGSTMLPRSRYFSSDTHSTSNLPVNSRNLTGEITETRGLPMGSSNMSATAEFDTHPPIIQESMTHQLHIDHGVKRSHSPTARLPTLLPRMEEVKNDNQIHHSGFLGGNSYDGNIDIEINARERERHVGTPEQKLETTFKDLRIQDQSTGGISATLFRLSIMNRRSLQQMRVTAL